MLLNNVFSVFDELLVKHSLEKIKTIGDSYMLAGGVPEPSENHATSVAEMALDMLEVLPKIKTETQNSLLGQIGRLQAAANRPETYHLQITAVVWSDRASTKTQMPMRPTPSNLYTNAIKSITMLAR